MMYRQKLLLRSYRSYKHFFASVLSYIHVLQTFFFLCTVLRTRTNIFLPLYCLTYPYKHFSASVLSYVHVQTFFCLCTIVRARTNIFLPLYYRTCTYKYFFAFVPQTYFCERTKYHYPLDIPSTFNTTLASHRYLQHITFLFVVVAYIIYFVIT